MLIEDLPSNEDLIRLPPLPKTPKYRLQDIIGDLNDIHDEPEQGLKVDNALPRTKSLAEDLISSPPQYPVTSSRNLSLSPRKHPSTFSPARQTSPTRPSPTKPVLAAKTEERPLGPQPSFLAPPRPGGGSPNGLSVSAMSFRVPSGALDASLLGHCAPPSEVDQTFNFEIEQIRPATVTNATKATSRSPARRESPRKEDAPAETLQSFKPRLDQSTLLPSTNSHNSDLLSSTNALDRVQPPWTETTSSRIKPSTTTRSFPSSSSGSSLNSIGEDTERGPMGDVSTLLPFSEKRQRHLLRDEHLLKSETLPFVDDSFMPGSGTAHHGSFDSPPKPARMPPPSARKDRAGGQADMTLDMAALLDQMKNKPSGEVEESFVDLLHGKNDFDMLNMSILGGDESFLPSSLRPTWGKSGTMPSPRKRTEREAARAPITPAAFTSRKMDTQSTVERTARRRSRSLHETANAPLIAVDSVRRRVESGLSAVTPRAGADPITPSVARARSGMAPPGSKRASLSAGAVPMTGNASHRKMELPPSTRTPRTAGPGATRGLDSVALSRAKSIERRARHGLLPLPGDGSPVQPTFEAPSRRGLSTPGSMLSKRSLPPADTEGQLDEHGRIRLRDAPEGVQSARTRTLSRPLSGYGTGGLESKRGLHSRSGSTAATLEGTTTRSIAEPKSATHQRTLSRPTASTSSSGVRASASIPDIQRNSALPARSSRPTTATTTTNTTASSRPGREFGRDGAGTVNRLSRPMGTTGTTATSSLASKRSIGSKLSTDPASIASPAKRANPVSIKSRAMSTPATAVVTARSRPTSSGVPSTGRVPPSTSSTSLSSNATRTTESRRALPGATSTARTTGSASATSSRVGGLSALPRPGVKTSTGPSGISRLPAPSKSAIGGGAVGGFDGLNARLSKLSLKHHQTSRRAA